MSSSSFNSLTRDIGKGFFELSIYLIISLILKMSLLACAYLARSKKHSSLRFWSSILIWKGYYFASSTHYYPFFYLG